MNGISKPALRRLKCLNKKATKLTVVVPVYNEADSIASTIKELYDEIASRIGAEILVCEDGSTDGTKEVLKDLAKEFPIQLILEPERKGYLQAVKDALLATQGEYVLFLDSDGQYLPVDFWKLWEQTGRADIVIGQRMRRVESTYRRLLSKGLHLIAKLLFDLPYKDTTSAFRLIRREVAHDIAQACRYMKYSFWTEFTIRAFLKNYASIEVPVSYRERVGSSRVYVLLKTPKIVLSQLTALYRLWKELNAPSQRETKSS